MGSNDKDIVSRGMIDRLAGARLAVIGGGPVGIELVQAFARLGSSGLVVPGHDGRPRQDIAQVLVGVLGQPVGLLNGDLVGALDAVLGTR